VIAAFPILKTRATAFHIFVGDKIRAVGRFRIDILADLHDVVVSLDKRAFNRVHFSATPDVHHADIANASSIADAFIRTERLTCALMCDFMCEVDNHFQVCLIVTCPLPFQNGHCKYKLCFDICKLFFANIEKNSAGGKAR